MQFITLDKEESGLANKIKKDNKQSGEQCNNDIKSYTPNPQKEWS